MCCVRYAPCGGAAAAFTIGNAADATPAASEGVQLDTGCPEDYVGIDGVMQFCEVNSNTQVHTRLCGLFSVNFLLAAHNSALNLCGKTNPSSLFSSVGLIHSFFLKDCTAPFKVTIVTDNTDDTINTAASDNKGVCLEYMQTPC